MILMLKNELSNKMDEIKILTLQSNSEGDSSDSNNYKMKPPKPTSLCPSFSEHSI
jgi:hypothetical protein